MSSPEYSRLLPSPQSSESGDVELLTLEDSGWPSTIFTAPAKSAWLSESTAWRALTLSLVLSLAISAINLTFLSTWATVSPRSSGAAPRTTTSRPLDYPNVYIGLEDVAHDPSRCLHRGTFPDTFYTYDARNGLSATLKRVQAPDDDVTLTFGGPIRAVVETRVLDYGLENCTFVVHSSNAMHSAQGRSMDVYMLPTTAEKPGEGQAGVFLERLAFVPGQDSMSRPFHCPSRARFRFELRCGEADSDCVVHVPLQGLTSKTSSSGSAAKTGFRINQYEAVGCISGSGRN